MKTAILAILLSAVVTVILIHPMPVISQSVNQSQLNKTIQDVQRAESAGADTEEMNGLIIQLNYVLELQNQLNNIPQEDVNSRTKIVGQINSTISTIDAEANQIEMVASQRTLINHLVTYSSGAIAAAIATIACHYSILLWRKYRIKRTFQMRIIPK